eukprot:CAMPEP_0183309678 /NCGR_PEP_ID=MMETSP0160_2-20130417/25476_1 /TAXON_ID=2839 ORGANISM="Odontella Sinensis, Strain Grunow 1884" /NCGR_SAMPLE_ID=MMETSP0160_2 /ASSEMBLY_ACC=CAM_ASM_000250 /LENGTH=298 /DNA_ID=CAMNT_0025473739 /DNA_START=208 /DNA_END=1104 /DNA_ORIENTATION=-
MRTPRLASVASMALVRSSSASTAAFSTLSGAAATPSPPCAFVVAPSSNSRPFGLVSPVIVSSAHRVRPLSSRRGYDYDPDEDGKEKGFLEKAADAAKSILPSNWFKTEEQKKAQLARKRTEREIKGGLSEVLKDAPLPVRMMGGLLGSVASKAVAGLAETMEEQRRTMEGLLEDARSLIASDFNVAGALGEPVSVGNPFSQSSSTSSINGRTTTRVQASFPVSGSIGEGIATMVADGEGIQQLSVNVGGRTFNVNPSGSGSGQISGSVMGGTKRMGRNARDGDVIDAEIIDAEFTEKK